MVKLPVLSSKEVERLLVKTGFVFIRQKGSHRIFIRDSEAITVPFRRKPLKKGTLAAILRQAGLR